MKKEIRFFTIAMAVVLLLGGTALAVWYYDTYRVVDVTDETVVLEHPDGNKVEIDKSRRPYLRKGDEVRYDKYRNRLGRTLDVWYYDNYEVVEVTGNSFVLEGEDGGRVEIDKSRRPGLKKGDRVRYDKESDELGRTLD